MQMMKFVCVFRTNAAVYKHPTTGTKIQTSRALIHGRDSVVVFRIHVAQIRKTLVAFLLNCLIVVIISLDGMS